MHFHNICANTDQYSTPFYFNLDFLTKANLWFRYIDNSEERMVFPDVLLLGRGHGCEECCTIYHRRK